MASFGCLYMMLPIVLDIIKHHKIGGYPDFIVGAYSEHVKTILQTFIYVYYVYDVSYVLLFVLSTLFLCVVLYVNLVRWCKK